VVAGAWSPLATDAAVRVAMTGGLVSSTQVSDLSRRLAAANGRDEIEVIAEAVRLAPDQANRLRRRVIAQRAARTFSVDNGDFVVEERITVPMVPGSELDIRSVVLLGARSNLSDQRLELELAQLGNWFQLKPDAAADLPYFGFAEGERAVVDRLRQGASFIDLHAAAPEIEGRTQRAIVYALVSCGACDASTAPPQPSAIDLDPPTVSRAPTRNPPRVQAGPAVARTASANAIPQPVTRTPSNPVPQPVTRTPSSPQPAPPPTSETGLRMRAPTGGPPMPSLATAQPQRPSVKPGRAKRSTAETRETEALIKRKVLDARGDHYQLIGVPHNAPPEEIQKAYFVLARKLHPDRLSAIGITDDAREAQTLFAQINNAFAVLNDPARRDEYTRMLQRGGEAAVRAEESKVEELALRVMRAEEAFRRGEMALRRDQLAQAVAAFAEAVELQPKETEYQAYLLWAKFAAAPDKNAIAADTRKLLQRAVETNDRSPAARFYLGRVERMLGREREALAHFQAVLMIKPNHAEAASEARVLEQRLKKR
jgi:DnaJ-like protein